MYVFNTRSYVLNEICDEIFHVCEWFDEHKYRSALSGLYISPLRFLAEAVERIWMRCTDIPPARARTRGPGKDVEYQFSRKYIRSRPVIV